MILINFQLNFSCIFLNLLRYTRNNNSKTNIMKTLILISIVLFSSVISFGQTKQDLISKLFKQIIKEDQSHLKQQEIRNKIFVQNFNLINEQFKQNNLTNSCLNSLNKKRLKNVNTGLRVTFIHILQTKPELILNEDYIQFIEKQITENDFDKSRLKTALTIYYYDMYSSRKGNNCSTQNSCCKKFNHEYDDLFFEAIKRWGFEESDVKPTNIK